ncbi:MAG: uroporphyrinogen decarboxylase [Gemmatimonadetes bacterium]|nr:uroporphyrinogen decarboxylase [Gemmatimonadota bacterium]
MNDRLIRALRRQPVDRTPVWFMRQAGRSLPRYRELKRSRDMFEILRDPQAAAEITMLPLEYYEVDAAIVYNDLSTPFLGAGLRVEMKAGVGPVVDRPIEAAADVRRLRAFEPRDALAFCLEQIRRLVEQLDVPVLGFVGAPFTLCSYLLPGPRARRIDALKSFLWREPAAWGDLAEFWTAHLAEFAVAQFEAGAAAVQVFDSWAGALGPEDYERSVMPYSMRLFQTLKDAGVPAIHFATGNPALLPLLAKAGGDAIGVDWRQPIDEAWRAIGLDRAVQGNLDPVVLLAGKDCATARAREILERIGGRPGHIFNLGHGILPETDPAVVRAVVECVHAYPVS